MKLIELFSNGKKIGRSVDGKFEPTKGNENFTGRARSEIGKEYDVEFDYSVSPVTESWTATGTGLAPFLVVGVLAVSALLNGALHIGFESTLIGVLFVVFSVLAIFRRNDPINWYGLLQMTFILGVVWVCALFLSQSLCAFCAPDESRMQAMALTSCVVVPVFWLLILMGILKK